MKTFAISDLHLNHANIYKYEPSRLKVIVEDLGLDEEYVNGLYQSSLEGKQEAREALFQFSKQSFIKRWNKVVSPEDIVYVLGDITLSKQKEMIKDFFSQLNGKKHLIRGNHDILQGPAYIEIGFQTVSNCPILFNNHIFLSHAPLPREIIPKGYINFFGHVHSNTQWNWERGICVSVEQTDFAPFDISRYIGNDCLDKLQDRHKKD